MVWACCGRVLLSKDCQVLQIQSSFKGLGVLVSRVVRRGSCSLIPYCRGRNDHLRLISSADDAEYANVCATRLIPRSDGCTQTSLSCFMSVQSGEELGGVGKDGVERSAAADALSQLL